MIGRPNTAAWTSPRQLEDENARLRKLLAEQMLDAAALRELLAKKMVGPAAKREGVAHLQAALGPSERRACSIVNADRKMIRYRSCRPPDTELRTHLRELANERKRFGYRRLFVLLRQQGEPHAPAHSSSPIALEAPIFRGHYAAVGAQNTALGRLLTCCSLRG